MADFGSSGRFGFGRDFNSVLEFDTLDDFWQLVLTLQSSPSFRRGHHQLGLRNLKSGNFEFACSRILAFPFDVGFGLGDPIVVDLDQHGADKSD